MYCPKCGEKVQDGEKYCRHCGSDLEIKEEMVKKTYGKLQVQIEH